jgi:UDP-N-acetylmuramoylalanine--D-glutamate ligase
LLQNSGDILLLEISDHQLCDFKDFKTNISVLTNICPTHLDYHGTYEHYKNTKKKIFNLHTSSELAIINQSDKDSIDITRNILSSKVYFNDDSNYIKNDKIYLNKKPVLDTKDIKLKGMHNYENILMALVVISKFGIDASITKEFLKNFGGVEHRIEFVCEKSGVEYYNDSKSTNPTATITALKTFDKPIHLILGGQNRNQDFNELNPYIKNVKSIYAVGEVTNEVMNYAKSQNIESYSCTYLKAALDKIKEKVESGDIVLLSPGSSSQDQYPHFEDRGNEFKDIIKKFEN